jgi:hypothetical protein
MNTTNLFVELIVIGIGAFGWAFFFALALLGYSSGDLEKWAAMPAIVAPALAVTYVLGIVTDRLADGLFRRFAGKQPKNDRQDADEKQYYKDRNLILAGSEEFARQYEYSRSRQRICRGWTVNAVALVVAINTFLFTRHWGEHVGEQIFCSMLLVGMAIACGLSWRSLNKTELARVKDEADFLRKTEAKEQASKAKA